MKFSQRITYTLIFLNFVFLKSFTQTTGDPTLFTVNNVPVKISEFLYIYGKNNGKEADYSKKSLDEYLELYKKFKLKVAKARDLRLDTLPDLMDELHMYKQQVSNSYIMDKEVTERLIKEVYERQRKDISVKHVFFQLSPRPNPADTLAAYTRAMKAYEQLKQGVPFGKVVMDNSDDRTNLNYSGDLGYVTSMLPDGFYQAENVIYSLPIGEFSMPVRTSAGYHIFRVDDIRPARREMEIAQVLIKKTLDNPQDQGSKPTADRVYKMLKEGADWNQMVQTFSGDQNTKDKNGYIGFVGINQFEKAFEDSVFAIPQDGYITTPIESRLGWHIIKRISKKQELPYAQAREKIKPLLETDSRYQIARSQVIDRIKSESGFKLNQGNLDKFIAALPADFTSFSWEVSPNLPDIEIMSFNSKTYTSKDLAHYLKNNTQERLQYPNGTPAKEVVPAIFNSYVNDKAIEYEQNHLAEVYPEFRNLMREYEEGILLFEITRQSVWDKAANDTIGLKSFYEKNKSNYKWNERAQIYDYTVKSTDEKFIQSVYAMALNKPVDKVIKKFNSHHQVVTFQKDILEKDSDGMKSLNWTSGSMTPFTIDKDKGIATWRKVEKILPASVKTLEESKGYVIADYQDALEKSWIDALQKQYKITVDQSVLDSLVKK